MFILDLIHKLIPVTGAVGSDLTAGGGGSSAGTGTSDKKTESGSKTVPLRSSIDWGGIGSTIGNQVSALYSPDPLADQDDWEEDAAISALSSGFAVSASMGFADFGIAGAVTAVASFFGSKEERKRAKREAEEKRRRQWQQAVTAHQNRLTDLGKSISDTERQVSTARVAGLAQAAGQEDLAVDAKVAASISKGAINYTALSEATAASDNLEASLMHQERTLTGKLSDLSSIQKSLRAEKMASRKVGEVTTKHFEDAQEKIDNYERRYS